MFWLNSVYTNKKYNVWCRLNEFGKYLFVKYKLVHLTIKKQNKNFKAEVTYT